MADAEHKNSSTSARAIGEELIRKSQATLAHGWMVRAFLRHSEEAEDFPELSEYSRVIFDMCRALEPFVETPEKYFRTLQKKISGYRKCVDQFASDCAKASVHTNFVMAAASAKACTEELEELLQQAIQANVLAIKTPK